MSIDDVNIMASAKVGLLDDDETLAFGEEENVNSSTYKHPYVVFFHLVFRISALVTYLFCDRFNASFISSFVTVVLLLSMDFWTVKNITGRLLVGLRWWNYVDDDGKSHWVFESRKGHQQNRIHPREARVFWTALILCPILWTLFFLWRLLSFSFQWLVLVSIALILNSANLYGYIKCRMGSQQSLTSQVTDFFQKQMIQNFASMLSRPAQPATGNATQTI